MDSTNMTCGLKVDTRSEKWHRTLMKVLEKIKGLSYNIDAEAGMCYISGRIDPSKLLKKVMEAGKHVELCWVKAGNANALETEPPQPPDQQPPPPCQHCGLITDPSQNPFQHPHPHPYPYPYPYPYQYPYRQGFDAMTHYYPPNAYQYPYR